MVKVIWTLQAVKDLDNIGEFIARDSIKYAKLTVRNIRIKTQNLRSKPYLGRVVPETGITEIRELNLWEL
jgi:plasmid stabilization system protein ParE